MITYELPINVLYYVIAWESMYLTNKWEELNFNWQG